MDEAEECYIFQGVFWCAMKCELRRKILINEFYLQILILLYIYPHLLVYLDEVDTYKFQFVFPMSRNITPNL